MQTYDITSIDALIRALGGPSAVGEWLGITQEAVSNWKARDNIPPGWHQRLGLALRKKGLTIDPRVFGLDDDFGSYLNAPIARVAAY